jgi:leucyl aminopeptidase
MEIVLTSQILDDGESDTLVFACYQEPFVVEGLFPDPETEKIARSLIAADDFKGALGEVLSFPVLGKNGLRKVILAGFGKPNEFGFPSVRKAVSAVIKEALRIKSKVLSLGFPFGGTPAVREADFVRLVAEIATLSVYSFETYKTEKKNRTLRKLVITCFDPDLPAVRAGFDEGLVLGGATAMARDLVNEPANVLTPGELARRAVETGRESGFEVEVLEEDRIRELGMKAFLEVARGSDHPPRLIVMRWDGTGGKDAGTLALVGKGLTYDTGGLSIKTNDQMDTMKRDMGGAASVIGAMAAVARLKLKARVVGVVAACENMVSARSYRPGDIIGSMAGKTIHVGNTDAEGRLTLADAVHYAIVQEGADKVVDLATLTGDATRTMGYTADFVVSNDDGFYNELVKASEYSGEKVWRMPVFDEHREAVKSDIADLTNTPDQARAITAGVFIGEFVGNKPWLHIDIAPTAWAKEEKEYRSKGGTGTGVRTMYYLVKGSAGDV